MFRFKPGDLFEFPVNDQLSGFARQLAEGSTLFYDFFSDSYKHNAQEIIESEILFIAHINWPSARRNGWKKIINIPLGEDKMNFYPVYFDANPLHFGDVNIYHFRKKEIDEAINRDWIKTPRWQLGGIHEHEHVISRIESYLHGTGNNLVKSQMAHFFRVANIIPPWSEQG